MTSTCSTKNIQLVKVQFGNNLLLVATTKQDAKVVVLKHSFQCRQVQNTHNRVMMKQVCAVQDLGADEVVDYTKQSVDQLYKNNPFDAVIDQIGGIFQHSAVCPCLKCVLINLLVPAAHYMITVGAVESPVSVAHS